MAPCGANCRSHQSLLRAASGPVPFIAEDTSWFWYWSRGIVSSTTSTSSCASLNSSASSVQVGSVASSCQSQ